MFSMRLYGSILRLCSQTVHTKCYQASMLQTRCISDVSKPILSIEQVRSHLRKVVGASKSYSDTIPDRSGLKSHLVDDQTKLAPRKMSDSFQTVCIPLSDKSIREKYINIHGSVRFGQLLENLDTFAVLISYQHNSPLLTNTGISPLSIVTAMVDEIKIHHDLIDPTVDIIMTGHVMWTGKSSLEIGMWLKQEDKSVLDAEFVMVARDPESKKAAVIHPLETTNEEERKLFEAGNQHKQKRLAEANTSLFQNPPTLEERQIVHEIFLKTLDPRSKSFRSRVLPEGSVWMESTRLKNAVVCFPEKRNIHNKVFGGYLMRKAFELAWANACVFSGNRPYVVAVDDILFHCPVPIGSLLLMSSQVSYSDGKKFIARVHAEVMDTLQGTSTTSNVFHFTFTCGDHPVPAVVPMTYGESMLYLDGLRRSKKGRML
nr:acyl-coenzyme A thioesterase 9, mitochondrial isoform X1 [Ciona intestinalis]|eukprot:XP_026695819.1 acyl-coenzyme A thioesterase 9, mitochondrial isoform X1 [Ciona intestinalis]